MTYILTVWLIAASGLLAVESTLPADGTRVCQARISEIVALPGVRLVASRCVLEIGV